MSNAVGHYTPDEEAPATVMNQSDAMVSMIERAALNPAVDIDKLERLLEMQERIVARNAKAAYAAAFADMQPDLPEIKERGAIRHGENKPVQSRYALWEDINEAIKPVLAKHGFGISFRVGRTNDRLSVTGILTHREGHSEETTMELPADQSGSKNAVQAIGSSTSYGKRYTAQALLNLTSRGEDDDGKAAGAGEAISDKQAEKIRRLIEDTNTDIAKFCQYHNVEAVPDIPAAKFDAAIRSLEKKRAEQAKARGQSNG